MHIRFDDKESGSEIPELVESFADIQVSEEPDQTPESDESSEAEPTPDAQNEDAFDEAQDGSQQATQFKNTFKYKSSHIEDVIIGNKDSPRRTRSSFTQEHSMLGFLSVIKPSIVDEALSDDGWIVATQEELNQLQRNDIWDLVARPSQKSIIGTKWVFRNKLNEQGEVVRNKARLVAQGYSQQESIYFTEKFTPVVRLEAIRLLLSYAVNYGIILHQMDVKSAFLDGVISEEVYVKQPPGFEDMKHLDCVYKLKKSLYGPTPVTRFTLKNT